MTVFDRVQKGRKWLDKHSPGWKNAVDTDKLDIIDVHYCVLGQVFGHFDDAIPRLSPDECYEMGFWHMNGKDAEELKNAWCQIILEMQC